MEFLILALEEIRSEIIEYLRNGNPIIAELKNLPLNQSLVELGYMDSFGIVDIIIFLESKYSISIADDEITKEKFGSINKMSSLVLSKI